jgi:DNA (cytosine-5)-methyltransferase 1
MTKLRVLDLFSGIGGFSLGLERTGGFETVAFCEIEEFPRKVLAKHWPKVPIYNDVRTLTAERLAADGVGVDVICGGFPCQDISSAGYKLGISGKRSGLWSEYARLVDEIRPRFILVENVSALLNRGLDVVLGDLASVGYDAEWHCISASMLGAPHHRDRFWLVAYPNNEGQSIGTINDETRGLQKLSQHHAADSQCGVRPLGWLLEGIRGEWESVARNRFWTDENCTIGMGVDDGLPGRMDRLRALGNAVVPQIPELIGNAILQSMRAA